MSKSEYYTLSFETFLASTNEKAVLLQEILSSVQELQPESLLDIGPGNGVISIPLSREVRQYVAIEKNPSYVERLRNAGLNIIEGNFPVAVNNQFDFILASHVISYENNEVDEFVKAAGLLLKTGGTLVVVTYRAIEDDWIRLMKELGYNLDTVHSDNFAKITEALQELGELKVKRVETLVETGSKEDMIKALAFVASDGDPDKAKEFLLKSEQINLTFDRPEYRSESGFKFPFQHYFLTTRKFLKIN